MTTPPSHAANPKKYHPFAAVSLPNRTWPDKRLEKAPRWCSVDLRDGNQALAIPMSVPEKLEYFEMLVRIGFKEIEVGFPSASQIEFDFIRRLIDENRVPDDVTLQVLVQSKEELIHRTFESLHGAKNAIVHLYNSTSPAQRRIVFGLDKQGIIDIAVRGTKQIKERVSMLPGTRVRFEYSPESFSATELDFALEICEAVGDAWGYSEEEPIIFNLPATVELSTPNHYADQIEWFIRHQKHPECSIISLHTHNDRGTGVAASELAQMAGATRVEGTLFGNGERTGNVDIVTLALNMQTQGVDPELDFSKLPEIREIYERCTRLEVPPRSPYGGDLVFTAFSGSHQDAINKGLKNWESRTDGFWEVPYLPLDPHDIGRRYQGIIRINSQSGKGGVAYILETEFGYVLPKAMHREIGKIVNREADLRGTELTPQEIFDLFKNEYLERNAPWKWVRTVAAVQPDNSIVSTSELEFSGKLCQVVGKGNGPVDAFVKGLLSQAEGRVPTFTVVSYSEHSLGSGAEAQAVAYFEIKARETTFFGAGTDTNIEVASLKAVLSAVNRACNG